MGFRCLIVYSVVITTAHGYKYNLKAVVIVPVSVRLASNIVTE